MVKIVIDAMGGDFAPEAQVKGSIAALNKDKDLSIVLVGDEEKIKKTANTAIVMFLSAAVFITLLGLFLSGGRRRLLSAHGARTSHCGGFS